MEFFEPKIDKNHKFGVAIPSSDDKGQRGMSIIETYPNLMELELGYLNWKTYADEKRIVKPYKVEMTGTGRCRVIS